MHATYLYHSFPRRPGSEVIVKGLATLQEILRSGLLLAPEKITFRESLADGSRDPEIYLFQKRICFTELAPSELATHAKTFGPFALEWDIGTLHRLGAVPVFYVPLVDVHTTNEGLGAALLARLGEIQEILMRLGKLKRTVRSCSNTNEVLNVTVNGRAAATSCTVKAAADLMGYFEHGVQPIENLTAAIRALRGFFYPMENLEYTGELGYYRQHEWRIIANLVRLGISITNEPSSEDI
jgi:hypothetical protein